MNSSERPNLVTEQLDDRRRKIHRLCAIARSAGYGTSAGLMYIGWSLDGRPIATTNTSALSTNAQQSLDAHNLANLGTLSIKFSSIEPYTYVGTGTMRNFLDTNTPIEDLLEYAVVDGERNESTITLSELSLLRAILDAKAFWQDTPATATGKVANAQRMYTVFVSTNGGDTRSGIALLFEPKTDYTSNQSEFKSFIIQTLSRLIAADLFEEDVSQKRGYAQIAEQFLTQKKVGGVRNALRFFRDSGILTYSDEEIDQRTVKIRSQVGRVLGFLKSVDVITVPDSKIQTLQNPLLHYDLYELEIDQLFDLTEALFSVAQTRFR